MSPSSLPRHRRTTTPRRRRAVLALGATLITTAGITGAVAAPAGAVTCSATGNDTAPVTDAEGDWPATDECEAFAAGGGSAATATADGSGTVEGTDVASYASTTAVDGGVADATATNGGYASARAFDSGSSATALSFGAIPSDVLDESLAYAEQGGTATSRVDGYANAETSASGDGSEATATASDRGDAYSEAESGGIAYSYATGMDSEATAYAYDGEGAYAAAGYGGVATADTTADNSCAGGLSGAYDTASDTGCYSIGAYTGTFFLPLPAPGTVPQVVVIQAG